MKYRYALYSVRIERELRKIIAVNDDVYRQHIDMDKEYGYENYCLLGIIETDLPPDELIEILEEGADRATYYKNNFLQIIKIINKMGLR